MLLPSLTANKTHNARANKFPNQEEKPPIQAEVLAKVRLETIKIHIERSPGRKMYHLTRCTAARPEVNRPSDDQKCRFAPPGAISKSSNATRACIHGRCGLPGCELQACMSSNRLGTWRFHMARKTKAWSPVTKSSLHWSHPRSVGRIVGTSS